MAKQPWTRWIGTHRSKQAGFEAYYSIVFWTTMENHLCRYAGCHDAIRPISIVSFAACKLFLPKKFLPGRNG